MCYWYTPVCPKCGEIDTRLGRIYSASCCLGLRYIAGPGVCRWEMYGGTTKAPKECENCLRKEAEAAKK
jgi:hypothetical protein